MMIAMLTAGIACLLAGILAIGFGIPVNEFSFGNTLILAGAVAACTGLIILSMWAAVRELKSVAERTRSGFAGSKGVAALPRPLTAEGRADDRARDDLDDGADASAHPPASPTVPWQEEAAARDRQEPAAAKPRRNLMFSSISRRERERAQARVADPAATDPQTAAQGASPAPETNEVPPATFDDAWPKSERSRPADLQRRPGRAPPTSNEPAAGRQPPAAVAEESAVTVLKSGVVDGMAYSLYSDGSIEAQLPEGMMRFASIDELRAHLDHRP